MTHQEQVDGLLEVMRRVERKFEKAVKTLSESKRLRFEPLRYIDKARTEAELLEHWLEKLIDTLETAAAPSETHVEQRNP